MLSMPVSFSSNAFQSATNASQSATNSGFVTPPRASSPKIPGAPRAVAPPRINFDIGFVTPPRAPSPTVPGAPSRLVAKYSPPRLNFQPRQKTPAELEKLAKQKAFAESRATHPDRAFSFYQVGALASSKNPMEQDEYATQIYEIGDSRIYLGSVVHTGKDYNALTQSTTQNYLEHLGVTSVVCVMEEMPESLKNRPDLNVFHIPVSDVSSTKLSDYFDETNAFINAQIACGKSVLVHCQMGISRSATIVSAWLIEHLKMTSQEAIAFLCEKRPQVEPNFGFCLQLNKFQKKLEQFQTE